MKKFASIFTLAWMFCLAMTAQNDNNEFNPASPLDPGTNVIDTEKGEVYLDMFEPGKLVEALLSKGAFTGTDIKKITVAAPMSEEDFTIFSTFPIFPYVETVDLSRSSGFDNVPENAFKGLQNLTTLLLPSCVKNIGDDIFLMPQTLEELYCYADTPPTVNESVFEEMTGRTDFTVLVPAESVDLYRNAPVWSKLNITAIADNSVSLTAILPQEGDYSGMYLVLTDESTGKSQRFLTGSAREYTFVGLQNGHTYTLTLQTSAGCVLSETRDITASESTTISISNAKQPVSVSLNVTDAEGNDVTSLVSVVWKSGDNIIGQGTAVSGLVQGAEVSCQITLTDELALRYQQPETFGYTVKEGENIVSITLESLPQFAPVKGEMKGSKMLLDIAYTPTEEGGELNPYDLRLDVVRPSSGEKVNDYSIIYPEVSFKDTKFAAGERVQVVISSKSNDFASQTISTNADASGHVDVEADITEYGKATINYKAAEGVMEVRCTVYDNGGKLVGIFSVNGTACELKGLADGAYTAVMMEKNQFFDMIPSLAGLQGCGLQKDRDYAVASISMKSGVSNIYNVTVPDFDETPFCHVSDEAKFSSNSTSATVFGYSTLKTKVEFKEEYRDEVSNVNLIITIPENAQYMQGSLIQNSGDNSFSLEDGRIIIPTGSSEYVRLCMEHTGIGASQFNAMLQYTLDDTQYTQSLGSIWIENELKINAPEVSSSETFIVHGQTTPDAGIKVYDKADLIGETTAGKSGSWSTEVRLVSPKNNSIHHIHAEITSGGQTARSEEVSTKYNSETNTLQKMQMKFQESTITFNPQTGSVSKAFYTGVLEDEFDYTFTAEFDKNNPDMIGAPRFRVLAADGMIRFINARYNYSKNLWTAHTTYSKDAAMPVNMAFDYVSLDSTSINLSEIADEDISNAEEAKEIIAEAIEEKLELDDIPVCTDSEVIMNVHLGNTKYILDLRDEDYDATVAALAEEDLCIAIAETDTFYVYSEATSSSLTQIFINHADRTATSIAIIDGDQPVKQRKGGLGGKILTGALKVLDKAQDAGQKISDGLGYEDIAFSKYYYDEMEEVRQTNIEVLDWLVSDCWRAFSSICPETRDYRVPPEMRPYFKNLINAMSDTRDAFDNEMKTYKSNFLKALAASIGFELTVGLISKGIKLGATAATLAGKGVMRNVSKIGGFAGSGSRFGSLSNILRENVGNTIKDKIKQATGSEVELDFMKIKQEFDTYVPKEQRRIALQLQNLRQEIIDSYQECKKEEEEEHITVVPPADQGFPCTKTEPVVDPSGYVYEAVPENRIEGVTATIYYKADKTDDDASAVLWNAADYDQMNPLLTDKDGIYMWNVPRGMWQVRFQKDGYEPTQTEWLPVPPPQLDINVPMTQLSQPEVKDAAAYNDRIEVTFSKYVKVSTGRYSVVQNGKEVEGSLVCDADEAGLASSVTFVPAEPFTASAVELTVSGVKSYADIAMAGTYSKELPVEIAVEGLYAETQTSISCDLEGTFTVTAYPAEAVAGKALTVELSSDIVSLVDDDIRFDSEGVATIRLMGELPGTANVKVSIGGLTATTTVNVEYDLYRTVGTPIASIPSGEVTKGTAVELRSATEGATIYYTLDGSCPCDDTPSRHEYDGTPITINSDVTINAIAICADMLDSKVATYTYTVTDASGVDAVKTYEVFTEAYYSLSGTRMMPPLRPGLYIHVAKGRNGTMSKKVLIK